MSQVILTLAQGQAPGVLYLDDLQWADSASLALLSYITRRLNAQPSAWQSERHPLCLLLTWRSEEVARKHPLRQLVAEAQRISAVTMLSLARLDQSAIVALLHSTLLTAAAAQQADIIDPNKIDALGKRLYQESEGLPLMAVEYLDLIINGVAPLEADAWQLPVGVRDLLHSRLDAVSDASEQILNTAAVIGRSFPFDILREASGRSEEECVVALEDLLSKDLILELDAPADNVALVYDFCHEKLRTIVYEETSLPRRRLLHRRVAETLLGHARRRGQEGAEIASVLAYHYALAGLMPEAANYDYLAGERARSLFANREALAHFQACLAHGHPKTVLVHTAVGDLHTLLGEYNRARQSYETAAALAQTDELSQLESKLGQINHRLGFWEAAESHYQAALAALPGLETTNAQLRAQLFAARSLAAHQQGNAAQASALAEAALTYAQTALDQSALAQAHNILGILARHAGVVDQATHHLAQSVAIAERVGELGVQIAASNNLALLYNGTGQTERAITLLETALLACHRQGDRHREAALHNNLADLYHANHQPEQSMDHLKQAVVIFAEIGGEVGRENVDVWRLTEW